MLVNDTKTECAFSGPDRLVITNFNPCSESYFWCNKSESYFWCLVVSTQRQQQIECFIKNKYETITSGEPDVKRSRLVFVVTFCLVPAVWCLFGSLGIPSKHQSESSSKSVRTRVLVLERKRSQIFEGPDTQCLTFGNLSLFPQTWTWSCSKKSWWLFTPSSSAPKPSPATPGTCRATPSTGSAPSPLPVRCSSWARLTTLTFSATGKAWTQHASISKGRPGPRFCWKSLTWRRRTRGFTPASWRTGRP